MGTLNGYNASSDRPKWQKIFNSLLRISQPQQTQSESLAKEFKLLQDRFKFRYNRRVSDVYLYRDQISQMKRDFAVQEMARNVEAAKYDLLLGLKQREAFVHKLKLDNAASDLADFRVSFDYHSTKSCETNENDSGRNFIWNQYKNMESDLTQRLSTEVEQANEKIQKLVASLEQLQSLNSEKDRTILTLKTSMAELEASSVTKSEEISKLSRELKLLRDARSNSAAPVLRNGSAESRLEHKNRSTGATNITPKKKPRISGKGCESSKRKAVDGIPISEPPKLFTSTIKVPKLKNSSSRRVI